jgi:cystathionine beta-lyase
MDFDFDALTERRGTDSLKWDIRDGELPMWVADMDFKTAPAVTAALQARAAQGIFGYSIVPEAWRAAICGWWQSRHSFAMRPEWLVFCTGVVPAISSMVRKLTTVGENVLVQTPVYNIFFNSIVNNGRHILESPLRYADGAYAIDWDDLERKLADPQTTLLLLCNPHNPIGKIWDAATLARIGALCRAHSVVVVSDEIHCDLTDPGCNYVPFASVSGDCAQNSVTCLAPTKTFNLAGLQTAAVMIPNEVLRHKVDRGLNTDEVAEPNAFAVTAAIAAFTQGAPWLDALRGYLLQNKTLVRSFIARELPQLCVVPSEATYLLWLDCRALGWSSAALAEFIRQDSGLWLSAGASYGKTGEGFLRMNIACPRARVEDGLRRLKQSVEALGRIPQGK